MAFTCERAAEIDAANVRRGARCAPPTGVRHVAAGRCLSDHHRPIGARRPRRIQRYRTKTMYLFDAKIVAADNSGLAAGRFIFHPDPDSEISFAVPETAIVAVEVNERVTHIRPVLRATRRWDGFFDVDSSHTVFSSEKITSHILGDRASPGHAGALEAVWTGSVGLLTGPCSGNLGDPAKSIVTSLRRLTLRTSLCDGGLYVSVVGEIGGTIFVGNTPPRATPKGRIEIELTLSWDWIAIRGWSLIWEMPTRSEPQIKAERKSGGENPRHFEKSCLPSASCHALA